MRTYLQICGPLCVKHRKPSRDTITNRQEKTEIPKGGEPGDCKQSVLPFQTQATAFDSFRMMSIRRFPDVHVRTKRANKYKRSPYAWKLLLISNYVYNFPFVSIRNHLPGAQKVTKEFELRRNKVGQSSSQAFLFLMSKGLDLDHTHVWSLLRKVAKD